MPKGKKKGGKGRVSQPPSDEEYDTADNVSTASVLSEEHNSIPEEDGVDEASAQENFEDKLKECIEGILQKSAQGRKLCLEGLIKALSKKCISEFLHNRKMTVSDCLVKCIKKGKGDEQALAAQCLSLMCVQLGLDLEEEVQANKPQLLATMTDNSAAVKGRAECALTLGICHFLACSDIDDVMKTMDALEGVFRLSYRKGDKSIPNLNPEMCRLHAAALSAWSLLLSIAPPFLVNKLVESHIGKLPDLLLSNDVELRITAGETIALMYELAREGDEEFEGDDIDTLIDTLKTLATDSQKYRAKKERRQQRSSFRDILRTVEEGDSPENCVKFGKENFLIDSWVKQNQYDALCLALTSGIYQHLQDNILVREVFGLGEPLLPTAPGSSSKPSKWERAHYNAAVFKARTKVRSKHRDKRTAMINGD
ncbi:interferon-related developmental regulator 1-like [Mizuhopecten yessoensis]|uniref:Interferon-related developmental regulator 1 n=1 Tax=Mizuhopecten yessoensis TaxID=6573 RepID=A0A210PYJ6_MIZYE|nr:interferon-related developmental regulator 1-like [Mizuhopecten yessoensis]OWF41558.1 Interferon-related developmental regulator 1 [Mizuhopecten yessoensis]